MQIVVGNQLHNFVTSQILTNGFPNELLKYVQLKTLISNSTIEFTHICLTEILTNGVTNDLHEFVLREFLQIVLVKHFYHSSTQIFLRMSYLSLFNANSCE